MDPRRRTFTWGWTTVVAAAVVVLAFLVMALIDKGPQKSPLETDLLTLLLTLVSGFVGWLVSKHFAEHSATQNLRDYGVQVARGEMVLQSQLAQLRGWIADKRVGTMEPLVDAQFDHIQEMLIGFQKQSETTLNAIAGLIGEELKQHDDVLSQIHKIRSEALQAQARVNAGAASHTPGVALAHAQNLPEKLDAIGREAEEKIQALAKRAALPVLSPLDTLRDVSVACPHCQEPNTTTIGGGAGQTRRMVCKRCAGVFNVHTAGTGSLFTRPVSLTVTPLSGQEKPAPLHTAQDVHRGAAAGPRGWTDWRLPFDAAHFEDLCRQLLAADAVRQKAQAVWTINELVGQILNSLDPGTTRTTARRFVQLLFNGRLFLFEQVAAFSVPYLNSALTRESVLAAMARYSGYQFRLCQTVCPRELISLKVLREAISPRLSEIEAQAFAEIFAKEFEPT